MNPRRVIGIAVSAAMLFTFGTFSPARAITGYVYGNVTAYWDGLTVYASPDPGYSVTGTFGEEWQCVELVQRYYYQKRWTKAKKWGVDAWQISEKQPAGATFISVGSRTRPVPGDALVFDRAPSNTNRGHVALITNVSVTSGWVTIVQQNFGKNGDLIPVDSLSMKVKGTGSNRTYWPVGGTHGYAKVLGWLHADNNEGSKPAAPVVVLPQTGITRVDLGNPASESGYSLQGWGAAQGPPNNPYVSPTGDRTKRYQVLRGDNSLTIGGIALGVPLDLVTEVEDGDCTDNFEILINGMGLYSFVADPSRANVVRTHRVLIPAAYVTDTLKITFRNTSTDNCGLAAVYNVRLTTP